MKKTLAVLLSLIMVLALIPAAFAEDAEEMAYRLVIKGGETKDNMAKVGDANCLKVEVALAGEPEEAGGETPTGTRAEEVVYTATFDINYDAAQLTLKDYEPSENMDSAAVNGKKAGVVRCSFVSVNGVVPGDSLLLLTLYFELAEDLEAGTEIAFTLEDGANVENTAEKPVISKALAADFTPYVVSEITELEGEVVINKDEVEWKGDTPYLVYDINQKEYTPGFKVLDKATGEEVDPQFYDFEYKENTLPGTGYIFVYFKGAYSGECQTFFKIYLPASEDIKVENVDEGIKVTWAPVEGAAGYVIYRRAWNLVDDGWTAFARWNNTTATTYIDGVDESHKVFAGTRYQYGVKAYFTRRLDPVAGTEIGGNVNDNSGNFNLGLVSPLKTTVRITSRKLNSVEGGKKQMTIKWAGSKNFTGYQIKYATDAAFTKNVVAFKITDPKVYETTVKDLAAGTYYVTIRSYHEFNGMTYYGAWSNVLSATVK